MRLIGILSTILGCLLTAVSIAFPFLQPFLCVGVLAAVCGLILVLTTNRLRAAPTAVADSVVAALFENIAGDPMFHLLAGLGEHESGILMQDLSTASYRWSTIIQGGYAGRDPEGRLVLALSPWHLRGASAAHELFHLVRDVIFRCSEGRTGRDLNTTTGILREEVIVWFQTLSYLPIRGAAEIVVPIILVCIVPLFGAYLLERFVC